jgi:hypothetical protein
MNSRLFASLLLFALACLFGLFAACCIGGCTNGAAADYDRAYSATYDLTSGQYGGMVSITPAAHPGAGKPSLGLGVTGRAEPNFTAWPADGPFLADSFKSYRRPLR